MYAAWLFVSLSDNQFIAAKVLKSFPLFLTHCNSLGKIVPFMEYLKWLMAWGTTSDHSHMDSALRPSPD